MTSNAEQEWDTLSDTVQDIACVCYSFSFSHEKEK